MNSISLLNILKTRSFTENVEEQILKFESNTKIKLPPIFRAFYRTYAIEDEINYCFRHYYDEPLSHSGKSLITRSREFIPKPNYLPALDYFFSLDKMETVLRKYQNDGTYNEETESSLKDKKLLPILKHDNEMLITVCYDSNSSDNIFLYNTDLGEGEGRFQKLADDVFHYLRGTIVYDDENQKELYASLTKNWNDEHWRIAEPNSNTEDNKR